MLIQWAKLPGAKSYAWERALESVKAALIPMNIKSEAA